ncbi:MAG: T9SS type A sorting domain-containing protein [Candidatus Cloacimonetes bacterium]|nr:T9SS type A sorting domain-containing protein [Candidatus Cloacimonadota bacterium]MCF7813028.1 T9SS type A sorting domain-containing protein [Candidatus Cloacimonadota bacterium]MCF7867231.1 T9SS type A sorting domain-containing protein [Candidatus Cloacimonadota bacterium]MCF7882675.1 T9SS type A sorting domain-containing protein [Candidatus Cloacimonadota bacterium]
MKKLLLSILIVFGILFPNLSFARKTFLPKTKLNKKVELRSHPVEKYFNKPRKIERNSRNFNKLLVLLIDFQEDTDTQSTGNGKFVQDPADYPIDIGSPPHDHEYFSQMMEALRYYYLAVSYGSFDVDYDVYPQSDPGNFSAYTLPNEMRYYNPPGADFDLMISRFEEYFTDIFAEADQDEDIDFSQYEHFLVIHAGSDYQHDINGDTPADIPSFFIQIGTGKEYTTSDGTVIDHACNVPETIIQDVEEQTEGNDHYFFNYGVINSVLVHEFGHSIGFVDLYNTMNNTPQVGYYGIMDSGGAASIGYPWAADSTFFLEGVFPALPSPWSRLQAFEDDFRARGILKDISDFDLAKSINVLPSSLIFDPSAITDSTAYFVKVPLNDDEYLIIENRQLDPDGDGGATIITTDDNRIVLCPSFRNSNTGPNYEYDYLLPGFIDEDYLSYGGGLLVWHIDNSILQENDNYENNTVNVLHERRAVKIVEADNIDDIGNPFSMYWQGTEYEPFYKYMPILDSDGWFLGWDNETIVNNNGQLEFIGTIFSNELSSTSEPALITNTGDPSIFSITDISSYSLELDVTRLMSFKFGIKSFDVTEKIAEFDSIQVIGKAGNSMGFPTFPILADQEISFYSLMQQNWADNYGISLPFTGTSDFDVLPIDTDENGDDEFIFVENNVINSVTSDGIEETTFSDQLSDAPLLINAWYYETLVIPAADGIHLYYDDDQESTYDTPNAKIAFNGTHLIAAYDGMISFLPDISTSGVPRYNVSIPDYDPVYTPVSLADDNIPENNATFVQTENGNIYKIKNGEKELIFRLSAYTNKKPSQLALGHIGFEGNICLTFGAGNRVFAIMPDGTLLEGFPAYLENRTITPYSYPRMIDFPEDTMIILEEDAGGFVAVNSEAKMELKYSFFWSKNDVQDQFYWDSVDEKLFYIYANKDHELYSSYLQNIDNNPIIWNGFRNNGYSIFNGNWEAPIPPMELKFSAYAFPNPAKKGEIRFHVMDADSKIKIKIFDAAGNKIRQKETEANVTQNTDIRIKTSNLASGVYFAIIQVDGQIKKIPFAVEN